MYNKDELETMVRFDSYIKTCIKNFAENYRKANGRKWHTNAVLVEDYSDLGSENIGCESSEDSYFNNGKFFDVNGINIEVTDSKIIEALEHLPDKLRNVVLLYYFEEETEAHIAKMLNSVQQTVSNQKKAALSLMKEFLEDVNE